MSGRLWMALLLLIPIRLSAYDEAFQTFKGHSGGIFSIAFSTDGQYLVTGSDDATAILWEVNSGRQVRTFKGHSSVFSVAFSPDGKYIATGSGDATAILWEVNSGHQIRTFKGHSSVIFSVAFSPDGHYLATGSDDNNAILWNVNSGKRVWKFEGHSHSIHSIAFSPDGRYLATGSRDKTAILWEVSSGRQIWTFEGHSDCVNSVAFSPDGQYLATGSSDLTAILWKVNSGRQIWTFKGHSSVIFSVAFSPDGRYLATGSDDNNAILWNVNSGKRIWKFEGHSHSIHSVAFSPAGKYLAIGSDDKAAILWEVTGSDDKTAILGDVNSGRQVRTFEGHSSDVNSVAFSPAGKYLATGSNDKTAILWEVNSVRQVWTFEGHSNDVNSVAFSPDGKYLATGSWDDTAILWEVNRGRQVRSFKGHSDVIHSVAFSPAGKYLATGSWDDTAILWEVNNGRRILTFKGHSSDVNSVAFSPDGQYLATGSWDKTAILWEVNNGRQILIFKGHSSSVNSVAFSPDGKYLATASDDKTAIIWEVNSGRQIRTFKGHSDFVLSVAFSPDGQYLATGSSDNTAILWDVNSGRRVRTFEGHSSTINSIAFSPDGQYLATGSGDKTAIIWEISSPQLMISQIIIKQCTILDSLKTEYEEKVAALFAPQGEFETNQQYQKRLKNAPAQQAALEALYQQKSAQIRAYYEQQIRQECAKSRQKLVVKNSGVIGRYNIDKQVFPLEFEGKTYELKVPLNQAPTFKERFADLKIEFEKELNIENEWEYFNYVFVDPQTGMRYPFGEQRGSSPGITATAPVLPPHLRASLSFSEPSGEGFLDAGEKGQVSVEIINSGQGEALNLIAELKALQPGIDLYTETMQSILRLGPGEKKSLTFALEAGENLPSGTIAFEVKFTEGNGFEPEPIRFSIETRALMPPDIVIADFAVRDQSGNGKIERSEVTTVTVRLHNRGEGASHSSRAVVQLGPNVFLSGDSPSEFSLGNIPPGGVKDIEFTFYTNNRVQDKIPISLKLDEARARFQKNLPLDLQVNVSQKSLEQLTFKGSEIAMGQTQVGGLSVDIEQNIPQVKNTRPDAIAVVIGNRDYSRVKNVEFAIRDAEYIKDYLIKTLGYKEGNVMLLKNATKADFEAYFGTSGSPRGRLADLVKTGKSEVFIYYSGHGAPGLKDHKGYLVPIDCDPQRLELTGYPLDVFYSNLSQISAQAFTIVIDACFSGMNIYQNISPIVIEITSPEILLQNAVVFTSTGPNQVSSWYNEKFHSLFTYFFLKGLHNFSADLNRDRMITFQELYQYLSDQNEGVPYWARRLHGVDQTPTILGSRQDRILIKY